MRRSHTRCTTVTVAHQGGVDYSYQPPPCWWVQAYGDDTGITVVVHLPPLRLGACLRAAWSWLRPWLHWLIRLLLLAVLQQDTPDVA